MDMKGKNKRMKEKELKEGREKIKKEQKKGYKR